MRMFVKKVIGKETYTFEVEGNNLFEVIMEAQRLSFRDVPKCGLCDSDNLYLKAYKTTEGQYEYIKIICVKCKGSLTFGKRKDVKDTYFLRRTETGYDWKAFEKKENTSKEATPNDSESPF